MNGDHQQLIRLLRTQLTVVYQQFCHILALRQWGETEIATRIAQVDDEDFKNAMQIIDMLVADGTAVTLDAQSMTLGSDLPAIFKAEHRGEKQFAAVLEGLTVDAPQSQARVSRAAAPRAAYRAWLAEKIAGCGTDGTFDATNTATAQLMSLLFGQIEQAMVHAFMRWHAGDRDGADLCWKISGAAMLYATAIVRRGALTNAIPVPAEVPHSQFAGPTEPVFDRDIALVRRCADAARAAAGTQKNLAMARLFERIAADCVRICAMAPNEAFPAELGNSAVFASFAASRQRSIQVTGGSLPPSVDGEMKLSSYS